MNTSATLRSRTMLRCVLFCCMVFGQSFSSATTTAQEYLWNVSRAPRNVVPTRYVPTELQDYTALNTLAWSSTATTRVNNALLSRVTPDTIVGSRRNTFDLQLVNGAEYRRILAVFLGNRLARSWSLVQNDRFVIRATVDSLITLTGHNNKFLVNAGIVLERERDTVIAQLPVTLVDSSFTQEDRFEQQLFIIRRSFNAQRPEINFVPTSGNENTQITVFSTNEFGFEYQSDTLQLSVEGVYIGGAPVRSYELRNRFELRVQPGFVRSGEVTVNMRRREVGPPIPVTVQLPAMGRLPARDTTILIPSRREFIFPQLSGLVYRFTGRYNLPEITDFFPKSGNLGTTITVRGRNFTDAQDLQVWVGGLLAGSVTVDSPTQLRATIGYDPNVINASLQRTTPDGFTVFSTNLTDLERRLMISTNGAPLSNDRFPNATLLAPANTSGPIRIVPNYNIKPLSDVLSTVSGANTLFASSPARLGNFRFNAPSLTIATVSATSGSEGDVIVLQGSQFVDYRTVRQVFVCDIPAQSFIVNGRNTMTVTLGRTGFVRGRVVGRVKLVAPGSYLPNVDSTFRAQGRTITDSLSAESDQEFTFIQRIFPATITSFSPQAGAVGTRVIIRGTGLDSTREVFFGTVRASSFTIDSSTQMTAIVGPGGVANQSGEITLVMNADRLGRVLSEQRFTILAPPMTTTSIGASSESPATNRLAVQPNPTSGEFTLRLPEHSTGGLQHHARLRVADMLGRVCLEQTLSGDAVQHLSLGNLPAGMYILHLERGGERFTHALLKQ